MQAGIGVASVHSQWDKDINHILAIANDMEKSSDERKSAILQFLASENQKVD